MKRIFLFLSASALLAGVSWSLFAQDGTGPHGLGKVLLLQNERVFEGDIEKIGDLYRVKKAGGEMVVPTSQVLRLCADWDDAVAFMRSRANVDDPDERLRLARWCLLNHQIERARVEAGIALKMRPKHVESRQLVKLLDAMPTGNSTRPAASVSPAPLPHIDLSFESQTVFSQKVQPILMNTCVNCHSGTYQGKFRLYRLHEGGERIATQRNLAAVLAQVSLEKPAASPLLVMAVCAHGDAKTSPIPSRQSPAFNMLVSWMEQTIEDNPHLRERGVTFVSGSGTPPAPLPVAVTKAPPLTPPSAFAAPNPPVTDGKPATAPLAAQPRSAPVAEATPDEFSAAPFNQKYHPERK
jgi:hypothetical protein